MIELKEVLIGEHAIIALNSVVVKDVIDKAVVSGVPAKIIKILSFASS